MRPSFGPVRGGPVFEAVCFDAHVVGPVGRTLAEGVTGGEEPPELDEPPRAARALRRLVRAVGALARRGVGGPDKRQQLGVRKVVHRHLVLLVAQVVHRVHA